MVNICAGSCCDCGGGGGRPRAAGGMAPGPCSGGSEIERFSILGWYTFEIM